MLENQEYLDSQDSEFNIAQEIENREDPEGELHLCFSIPSGDEFALPAFGIREVMQQEADRITPIPNASPLLLGTINLRGEIIWVADLGQFLGYPNLLNVQRGELPVIAIEEQETVLGLAVEKLAAMQWLDIDRLQIPESVPDNIAPYIQGEWISEGDETRSVKLLDQIAILRSARWVA